MNAITQIRHLIAPDRIVIRRLDINRIPRPTDVIAFNQRAGGIEQMNPIAPVIRTQTVITANPIIADRHIRRCIQPHPERRPLQTIVLNHRAPGLPSHKNPRIQLVQIAAPVANGTSGKRHPLGDDIHRIALPAGVNHRLGMARHRHPGHPDCQRRNLFRGKLKARTRFQGIKLFLQVRLRGQR